MSSVSNFCPDRGEGGLFFRLTCSVMLWGGRNTANKYHWCVGVVLALSQPHWVCPHSRHMCFPGLHCLDFRLLCRERALGCKHFPGLSCSGSESRVLHKDADSVEPAFCAIPQSDQLRRPDAWRVHTPQERCILSPPQSQPLGFWAHPSPVCHVSLLGSWSLAATLPADVNSPESQEVFG